MTELTAQVESKPALQVMKFHGDEIFTFENDNEQYVAMRRIVENLGMSWGGQRDKLKDQVKKFSCTDISTAGLDGKSYEMLCMPVSKLPLWLASINPNKIKDEDRRLKIELYQEESARALYDYWTKGSAGVQTIDVRNPSQLQTIAIQLIEVNKELSEELEEAKPKVKALERISESDGDVNVTTAAKILQTGPRKLFAFLSVQEWIYRRAGNKNWLAYQNRITSGFLNHKVTPIMMDDGTEKMSCQVLVTPKGITKLAKMLDVTLEPSNVV